MAPLNLSQAPQRILAIVVTRIGDTLLCTPALRALKQRWPEAELTVWAHPKRMEVLAGLPFINHLAGYTPWRRLSTHLPGTGRFDLAVVFSDEPAQIDVALRAAESVLAFSGKALAGPRLTLVPQPACHAVMARLALLSPLAIVTDDHRLAYRVSPEETAWAARFVADMGSPLIVLQLHSFPTKAHRDWPFAHFEQLVTRLRQDYPAANFVVTGDHLAADSAARLRERCGAFVHSAAGKLSLRQTAALLAQADLYIGVDTGPTHLAGAVGIPMVGMYHAAYPGRNLSPLQHARGRFIEHPLTACENARTADMADISVDTVWQAANALLELKKS